MISVRMPSPARAITIRSLFLVRLQEARSKSAPHCYRLPTSFPQPPFFVRHFAQILSARLLWAVVHSHAAPPPALVRVQERLRIARHDLQCRVIVVASVPNSPAPSMRSRRLRRNVSINRSSSCQPSDVSRSGTTHSRSSNRCAVGTLPRPSKSSR